MRKTIAIIALAATVTVNTAAQPGLSQRALMRFTTYLPFEESNVEWQRDIYREVNLTEENNGGLGLANEPNIFSTVFSLALDGFVPAYDYPMTGNEVFNATTRVDMKELMKNFMIGYSEDEDGELHVKDEELTRTLVTSYFIREKVYYDKANSTFRTRVAAICPVLVAENDEDSCRQCRTVKYPMFWVMYDDVEPYLKDFLVYSSNYNKAAVMTAADYFTRHLYKGDIYKVFNTQGKTLAETCRTATNLREERRAIERQLQTVRENTYHTMTTDKTEKTELEAEIKVIKRPTRIRIGHKKTNSKHAE